MPIPRKGLLAVGFGIVHALRCVLDDDVVLAGCSIEEKAAVATGARSRTTMAMARSIKEEELRTLKDSTVMAGIVSALYYLCIGFRLCCD